LGSHNILYYIVSFAFYQNTKVFHFSVKRLDTVSKPAWSNIRQVSLMMLGPSPSPSPNPSPNTSLSSSLYPQSPAKSISQSVSQSDMRRELLNDDFGSVDRQLQRPLTKKANSKAQWDAPRIKVYFAYVYSWLCNGIPYWIICFFKKNAV